MRALEWEVFHHTAARIREAIARHRRIANEREVRPVDCPRCNPTARAMERVRDLWIAAGIKP